MQELLIGVSPPSSVEVDFSQVLFQSTFDQDPPINLASGLATEKYGTGNSISESGGKFDGYLVGTNVLGHYLWTAHERLDDVAWTIEGWVYYQHIRTGTGRGSRHWVMGRSDANSGYGIRIDFTEGRVTVKTRRVANSTTANSNQETIFYPSGSPFDRKWAHFALMRQGDLLILYVNGQRILPHVDGADILPSGWKIDDASLSNEFAYTGTFSRFNMDEWRVVNGVAVYHTNFIPPTEPYPSPVDEITVE